MNRQRSESGFTIVELLVTLGIAMIFLAAGYMLYQTLITRSAVAQWQLKASNLAASQITEQSSQASDPCTDKTLSLPAIPDGTLPGSPSATAEITCPNGTSSPINRITVTVSYHDIEDQEVVRARDINASQD